MQTDPLFSVIIPVKNGDFWLERLFQALMRQTLFSQTEIIVIDSGSTDKSLEIIRRYQGGGQGDPQGDPRCDPQCDAQGGGRIPIRLIEIPAAEFNHGETRNLGVRAARGEFVVMTVQDAVPASDHWLQFFLTGFADDKVAAICGQQVVPHERDKNPVLWYRPVSAHQTWFCHFESPEDFEKLSPSEQRQITGWDNVVSAYRRKILLENPFQAIDFAEDLIWAKGMLLKGHTLGHVSEAIVFHYHHHLPEFVLPRYFSVYYFEYKIFGLRPGIQHSVWWNIGVGARVLLKEKALSPKEKFKWLIFTIRYWIALKRTIKKFNAALDKGDASLDVQYRRICKRPPQAIKY